MITTFLKKLYIKKNVYLLFIIKGLKNIKIKSKRGKIPFLLLYLEITTIKSKDN